MLKTVTKEQIVNTLRKEHPYWVMEEINKEAQFIIDELDERLEPALLAVVNGSPSSEYEYEQLSIWKVRAICKCSDFEAIRLLDVYIKDPSSGRFLITRRR